MNPRRRFLRVGTAAGAGTALYALSPLQAWTATPSTMHMMPGVPGTVTDLVIAEGRLDIDGQSTAPTVVNGVLPGPVVRFREGETATIRVTNRLRETTSIHWHGLLVPPEMDGVPGVSFDGIAPGETFTYQFKLRQNGTYWYHSHSGNQEQAGLYGPLIIDPVGPEPFSYDSECVVMLSDWTFEDPGRVLAKMKKFGAYYNFNRRTLADLFRDASRDGWRATIADRALWAKMRMDPTDIADLTGFTYTYLLNGQSAKQNWTTLFKPGERIRMRFINAGAMTHFDVRIPGLQMTLVQADGQNVEAVTIEEFRIAPAESYDMIVQPRAEEAYTIFAESMDRSGYAAGTLAQRAGLRAPIPERRKRPLRTMADMGMSGGAMAGMAMPRGGAGLKADPEPGMAMPAPAAPAERPMPGMAMPAAAGPAKPSIDAMPGMAMPAPVAPAKPAMDAMPGMAGPATPAPAEPAMDAMPGMAGPATPAPAEPAMDAMPGMVKPATDAFAKPAAMQPVPHGPDRHGAGNSTVAEMPTSRMSEPGTGLGDSGRRVLVYTDLRRLDGAGREGTPGREIELHLTGNMERQIWGFDGKKYSEAEEPIPFGFGERIRVTFVNDTMMDHPMHLHGMWMVLENGAGAKRPLKHTINVKAGERISFDAEPDEVGKWAFHCHLLFHMELGMLRVVAVGQPEAKGAA
ncbi:copper resistance system multicopper oxidase [Piscinibacter koreensis]|uniref:Copper resistance system multicopper oxidase n=1 Tax=Piscinibacter koreensis TaxID=2742824 RepID=A0A7Y6TYV8_9BURK|nr:copper resistance system multicopper oxidase [Schlegelella koreensis]NUZ08510.1 copper resistance system multicopper oxidase [Schlegelella koreensis]